MFKKIEIFIRWIENLRIPSFVLPLTGGLWALLRMTLESALLSREGLSFYMFLHGISTFIFTYLSGTIFISLFCGERMEKVMRISSFGFFLLIIPPLIDGPIFHRAMIYKYADPYRPDLPSCRIFEFLFSFNDGFCAGPGIRIEMWLIFLLVSLYIFTKRVNQKKHWKSFFLSIAGGLCVISLFVFILYQEFILIKLFPQFMDKIIKGREFRVLSGFEIFTVFQYSSYTFILLLFLVRKLFPLPFISLLLAVPPLLSITEGKIPHPHFLFSLHTGLLNAYFFLMAFLKNHLNEEISHILITFLIILSLLSLLSIPPYLFTFILTGAVVFFSLAFLRVNIFFPFLSLLGFEFSTFLLVRVL